MFTCPCCAAMDVQPPHGTGQPCPTAVALHESQIEERKVHAELLKAQREATLKATAKH